MASISFCGPLATKLNDFLAYKRSLGMKYTVESETLKHFDRWCVEEDVAGLVLCRELVERWSAKRVEESVKSHTNRCVVMRQFAIFLTKCGEDAYIYPPQKNVFNPQSYVPYIFTENEVTEIFKAADGMIPKAISPYIHEQMPLIMRILYGCGLRTSEIRNLKKKDVDVNDGVLTILNGKNEKDRLVPMSDSLNALVNRYLERIQSLCPNSGYLFPSPKGDRLSAHTIYAWFRVYLCQAKIPHYGRGKGPRVHDLRHTFAVHSMRKMEAAGMDLYAALPILSVYLGHDGMASTERYLRMTAQVYPEIMSQLHTAFGDIIPAVRQGAAT